MKLWKRLAAGLLAMVTAIGATISAGAKYTNPDGYHCHILYESKEAYEGGGYIINGGRDFFFRPLGVKDYETVETLTDLGAIENYGDLGKETAVLIPASKIANYPVNTIAILNAQITLGTGYVSLYITDGKREGLLQELFCYTYADTMGTPFIITKEMKKNGILFTGCETGEGGELSEVGAVTVHSVEFTNGVAEEYKGEWWWDFETMKFRNKLISEFDWSTIDENTMVDANYFSVYADFGQTDARATVFTPNDLSDFSVGDFIEFSYFTEAVKDSSDEYHMILRIPYYDDNDTTIVRTMTSDHLLYFSSGSSEIIRITEEIKYFGFGITLPDYYSIDRVNHYVPSENSEIDPIDPVDPTDPTDPVDPVVKPGFSTPAGETSVKEVPLGTVVTQKTAVSDEKYNERFVKKVAASDVVGKTKATFTLSNGTVTKTVSTTKYNTALTVDGETIPAGSGYVFLVYTLSGIPEDVTVTVSDVVLE